MIPVHHFLYLAALVFCTGLMITIIKRNAIFVLLGIELMLNACNLNLIAFNLLYPESIDGQMFSLFIIIVAVCEAAVGLALILRVYQHYSSVAPDEVNELKD